VVEKWQGKSVGWVRGKGGRIWGTGGLGSLGVLMGNLRGNWGGGDRWEGAHTKGHVAVTLLPSITSVVPHTLIIRGASPQSVLERLVTQCAHVVV
jgi:hypothetical protein